MIVRARTDINEELIRELITGKDPDLQIPISWYFFNSGSCSLRFFLQLIGEGKRVGVQVYTCPTVLDGILLAGCTPVFLDINPDYYTTTLEYVKKRIQDIDVLLLTHLFGIPNPDYFEIKKLCQMNHVVLIDDLCQTFHAKIGKHFIEDVSDNYFYSFFYDKPISSVEGGMLKVSGRYKNKADQLYCLLSQRDRKEGCRTLKRLFLMHKLLSPEIYTKEFRNGSAWKYILGIWPTGWNVKILYTLLTTKLTKVLNQLIKTKPSVSIVRLSDVEISYLMTMMRTFHNNNDILKLFFAQSKRPLPIYFANPSICCSIAKRAIVDFRVVAESTQLGLYNWPELICDKKSYWQFPNATSVITTHTNIPCWSKDWFVNSYNVE